MVAINDKNEVVAYLIWSTCSLIATIDILEVKTDYRRQGIGKAMMDALPTHLPLIAVLTAQTIPSSEQFFMQLGWQNSTRKGAKFKLLCSGVTSVRALPSFGCVIAICRQNYDAVVSNPERYSKRYFQISVRTEGWLSKPVFARFSLDSYMAIYNNQVLIAEGTVNRLFQNARDIVDNDVDLLVMSRIIPCDHSLFERIGLSDIPDSMRDKPDTETTRTSKRQRIEAAHEKHADVTAVGVALAEIVPAESVSSTLRTSGVFAVKYKEETAALPCIQYAITS